MNIISFDLVSPEKLLFNNDVGMIIVPGKDGDIGILPGHSKLLSSLRPGRVMVYGENKELIKSFFVTSGFVEINPNKCIILAEGVNEISDFDKNALKQQIQELENSSKSNSEDLLFIAKSKLDALDYTHYNKL